MDNEIRKTVALASRVLGAAGHGDLVWGHASSRDPGSDAVYIKEAGWGLEEVLPERVHLVDAAGRVVDGSGPRHSEYPIHTEIMAARPDVGGVVHTHSPYVLALAAAGQPLLPVSHAANYFAPHGVPRFTGTADLILTPDLGKKVAARLGEASAVFLVNHGMVTVGPDLPTATVAAILLEQAAKQQLLTRAFGGWATWSDETESASKRAHIHSDAAVRSVWDYLVRGLTTRSAPAADLPEGLLTTT
ncbi:class II aldolase/adducin family protein [Streptomyces sp. NPDC097610]|uniref:class II aldolase/adducin family protein n=1 Tax=Streptomyces sp. NPDC097610 TaxID=3157227 RepID=UPI00332E3A5A